MTGSLSSSSSGTIDDDSSSSSSGDKAEPAFAGTAAAVGSDWAATAAKAAQLRNVIEWGHEAYGVNAAGSEPSSEVSVVIWPGEGLLGGGCWGAAEVLKQRSTDSSIAYMVEYVSRCCLGVCS